MTSCTQKQNCFCSLKGQAQPRPPMPEVLKEEHSLTQLVPLPFFGRRPHSALAQPEDTPVDDEDDDNHAQRKGCPPSCCQPACYLSIAHACISNMVNSWDCSGMRVSLSLHPGHAE